MPFDLDERRMSVHLATVIDDALYLAEVYGWRYAIPYLISERIPSPVIQRLLQGGARFHRPASELSAQSFAWKGTNADDMKNLFASLRERKRTIA